MTTTSATRREPPPPHPDKLDRAREALRQDRDLRLRIKDGEEKLKGWSAELLRLEHEVLPDLFTEAGIVSLGLEPEGNQPGALFAKSPYYKFNIAADWPEEDRQVAFAALEGAGAADLIKTQVIVDVGRDVKLLERVRSGLDKAKVAYGVQQKVEWTTLTAWARNLVEKLKKMPPPELKGTVGQRVTIKQERANGSSHKSR